MKKKICFFTGTRAEYGLLSPLIDELATESKVELQIIITGMHLSPEFGNTYKDINLGIFSKVEKVEILLSSNSAVGVNKAMGLGMISFSEALERLKPDLLIGLGDRFELFCVVAAALVLRIPVAHISGGELTFAAYDDSFRHAITKMSHIHFTSTEEYRNRVIQLGENPSTVYNIGALGLDNIKKMQLLSLKEFEKSISFRLDRPFFVVTFHPVTLENNTSERHFRELLKSLDNFMDFYIIFTMPNADNDGRIIMKMIDEYVSKNKNRCVSFDSLGQLRYLSALRNSEMIIGNSSSGIVEMPMFKKPTINIGDRQKGRIFSKSTIQCSPNKKSIVSAIKKGLSSDFNRSIQNMNNLYGDGNAAKKIKKYLLSVNLKKIVKKEFFDLRD